MNSPCGSGRLLWSTNWQALACVAPDRWQIIIQKTTTKNTVQWSVNYRYYLLEIEFIKTQDICFGFSEKLCKDVNSCISLCPSRGGGGGHEKFIDIHGNEVVVVPRQALLDAEGFQITLDLHFLQETFLTADVIGEDFGPIRVHGDESYIQPSQNDGERSHTYINHHLFTVGNKLTWCLYPLFTFTPYQGCISERKSSVLWWSKRIMWLFWLHSIQIIIQTDIHTYKGYT